VALAELLLPAVVTMALLATFLFLVESLQQAAGVVLAVIRALVLLVALVAAVVLIVAVPARQAAQVMQAPSPQ
jgi:hypothetical protein